MRSMGPRSLAVYIAQTGRYTSSRNVAAPLLCADWLRKLTQLFWHVKGIQFCICFVYHDSCLIGEALTKHQAAAR
jgi:hypothetical protein